MKWLWFVLGVLVSGPLWLVLARLHLRRSFQRIRRIVTHRRSRNELADITALAGGLAHEIRNPLSTIKLNLQLLVEDLSAPPEGPRQKEHLRRLRAVSDQMARLQDVLEDFLRFAGRHELHLVPVDLGAVVTDMVDFFAPQADAAHVRIRAVLPQQPPVVRADADLLKQALLNLMINAQQAMPAGGELVIRVRPRRRKVLLQVIDTGCGMSKDLLAHVFDAYFTTKPGGTGLGLSIVRRIVREHGGQIAVDSDPGKGSTFTIILPHHK